MGISCQLNLNNISEKAEVLKEKEKVRGTEKLLQINIVFPESKLQLQ